MAKEYFPEIGKIQFEGPESKNPMAFHYYDAERVVAGKKMKDWMRFAMAWWHTLCAEGADQFGGGTKKFPWNEGANAVEIAKHKADAGFEIMQKLGVGYFCFHDVDLVSEGASVEEYEANLAAITDYLKQKMDETGIKLLWSTANVFGNARYMNGASTNPDFDVVARAIVQIKNAIDAGIKLGAENYVFWGGREGYMSLLNTDMPAAKASRARSSSSPSRASHLNTSMMWTPRLSSVSSKPTDWTRISRSTSRSTTPRWQGTPSSTNWLAP